MVALVGAPLAVYTADGIGPADAEQTRVELQRSVEPVVVVLDEDQCVAGHVDLKGHTELRSPAS